MDSSFSITLTCAPLPSLIYFKPLEGVKGGREAEDGLVAVKSVDCFFFFSHFLQLVVSVQPRGGHETDRQRMKESSECLVWKGDNKETEAPAKCRRKKWRSIRDDSEGGGGGKKKEKRRRQAEKQTEVEKRGGVTEEEKEQKMDTV